MSRASHLTRPPRGAVLEPARVGKLVSAAVRSRRPAYRGNAAELRRLETAIGGEKVTEGSEEERIRVRDWSCTVAIDAEDRSSRGRRRIVEVGSVALN